MTFQCINSDRCKYKLFINCTKPDGAGEYIFFKHDLTALRRGVTIFGEIIKQQLGETDAGSGHLNLVKASPR